MATIDKLALELDIEGALKFIKSLDDVDEKVKETRKIVAELTRGKDELNNSLSKNPKAKGGKKKGKKEPVSEFDKVIGNATSSLGKLVAGFSVAGLALKTVSAVFEQSAKAAQIGTSLSNQTRNTSIKTEEVETVQTTLKMMSLNEGALDGLLSDLSDNQNKFRAYGGGNDKIQNLIAMLNGFDKSGNKLSSGDTNPIQSLNAIAKMLQSNDETTKNGLVSQMMTMGISSDAIKALTNPNYFKFSNEAGKYAIQNADLVKKAEDNKAADVLAKKYKENEELKLFSKGASWGRLLNNLEGGLYESLNKKREYGQNNNNGATRSTTDSMAGGIKNAPTIDQLGQKALMEFNRSIKTVDYKKNIITMLDGKTYSGGFIEKMSNFSSVNNRVAELLASEEAGASYAKIQYQGNQNGSAAGNFNVGNIYIQSDAHNVEQLKADIVKETQQLANPSNLVPYISNIR